MFRTIADGQGWIPEVGLLSCLSYTRYTRKHGFPHVLKAVAASLVFYASRYVGCCVQAAAELVHAHVRKPAQKLAFHQFHHPTAYGLLVLSKSGNEPMSHKGNQLGDGLSRGHSNSHSLLIPPAYMTRLLGLLQGGQRPAQYGSSFAPASHASLCHFSACRSWVCFRQALWACGRLSSRRPGDHASLEVEPQNWLVLSRE